MKITYIRKTAAMAALCGFAAIPLLGHAQDAKGGAGGRDPEKMREMFEQRFKKADTNNDGKLTKAEAEAGMPRVAKNFDAIDANKDGFITQDEIRAAMQSRQAAKGGSK